MRVSLAAVADNATISADGKLNIMGIFTAIYALTLPATYLQFRLVLQLQPDSEDTGVLRRLAIQLTDPDGEVLLDTATEVTLPADMPAFVSIPQILDFSLITFQKAGAHRFSIRINGEEHASLPLNVIVLPPAQES